jgi:hypothetical protein
MRPIATLTLACALALGGCATTSFADYAAAANDLDPGCFKDVSIQATPILIFGWPIPVISGTYRKVCNPDQAPGAR